MKKKEGKRCMKLIRKFKKALYRHRASVIEKRKRNSMKEISIEELITKLEERRVFHYGISLYTNDGDKYWIYADDEGILSLNKMPRNYRCVYWIHLNGKIIKELIKYNLLRRKGR